MKRKPCKQCKRNLPLNQYDRNPAARDGRRNVCKQCEKDNRARKNRKKIYPFFSTEVLNNLVILPYNQITGW